MPEPYLKIETLKTYFPIYEGLFFKRKKGVIKAVDDVSLELKKGDILGLVGESGCGKSTLGRSIMQIEKITTGTITLDGNVMNHLPEKSLRRLRPRLQMIFQDPYASLNPRMNVFDIIAEPILYHQLIPKADLERTVATLMEEVGLSPKYMRKYPHEFSGGQRQRVAIARAVSLKPDLIIADEPVSALDVSVQSQILNLLVQLIRKHHLTMIFISHDLSVIRHITKKVAVMYLGKIVEAANTEDIYANPLHPYTQALFSAIPYPDPDRAKKGERIILKGEPPSAADPPKGCRFHTRCPIAIEKCKHDIPELQVVSDQMHSPHQVACHRTGEKI